MVKRDERYKDKVVKVRENGSLSVASKPEGESMAQQQYKDQCDVNKIMGKYVTGGVINHLNTLNGVYADLTALPADYMDAMNTIVQAQSAFETLPADVRLRFGNDPGQLVQFMSDPNMVEESIKLGLRTLNKNPDYVPPKSPDPATPEK